MPNSVGSANSGAQGLQGRRLVMRDNVHLFDPGSEQHEVLATEGTASTSPGKLPIPWFCIVSHVIPLCSYNNLSSRVCQLILFITSRGFISLLMAVKWPHAERSWQKDMDNYEGGFRAAAMLFSPFCRPCWRHSWQTW